MKHIAALLLVSLFLSACAAGLSPAAAPAVTLAPAASATPTTIPSATPTPIPSLTPTPTLVPVSVDEAIQMGTFTELETFGRGEIQHSHLSPDGSLFVAITSRAMFVMDPGSLEEITTMPLVPGRRIASAAFSNDGSLFAAGTSTGDVDFFDTGSWELVGSFHIFDGLITSLDISPDNQRFTAVGDEKFLGLWNMADGALAASQWRSVRSSPVSYSQDGTSIMLAETRDLTTFLAENLALTDRINYLGGSASAVSPFSDVAASHGWGTLDVYDFETRTRSSYEVHPDGRDIRITFLDKNTVMVLAEDSDSCVVVGLRAGTVSYLSLDELSGLPVRSAEIVQITREEELQSMGFSSDDYLTLNGITADGTALITSRGVFNLAEERFVRVLDYNLPSQFSWTDAIMLENGDLGFLDIGADHRQFLQGERVTQSSFTLTILGADFERKDEVTIEYDLTDGVESTALSPDGSMLAAGLFDGTLCLWDVDSGEQITCFRAHGCGSEFGYRGAFGAIAFSPDQSLLVTSGWGEKQVKVWNLEDYSLVASAYGFLPEFSPDGTMLAYRTSDFKMAGVIPLTDNSDRRTFDGGFTNLKFTEFSADGSLVYTGGWPPMISVWSVQENMLVSEYPQFDGVSSLVFSPDGTRVYVSGWDGVISAWGHNPD